MLALGAAAAHCLPALPQLFVLELSGGLGAGKTTFARGLLRALGVTRTIKSPSYGLLELYDVAGWCVLHLDLYRLHEPGELENLGLRDHHAGRTLWLVEWPEQGAGQLPPADARCAFSVGVAGHDLEAQGLTVAGHEWLACLLKCRKS